ncbi:cohesin subunit SA-2 [Thalassophryne amazonica]|uniref:cohesin subunit SA-2 n=1 Tax=Thalassophryne amazonica TaxID=390379 RepID=UPI001470E146|nr:cohesin subunit SA-2 [Thalassophryne amazonica]
MANEESAFDSLDEMDDISDSGSDFEVTMKTNKPKKRAMSVPRPQPPKRPRRKATASLISSPSCSPIPTPLERSLQQQPSRGTSRPASPKAMRGENQGVSPSDIYDAVRSGKSAMVTVVDEWLDSYKESHKEGLLVLINFIVQCCGCKGVVTREMFENLQNADIISTLTKEFNEDSVMYPLCTPGPQLKRFKAGLCEFARVLVRSCQNSLIYDEYLFPTLLALLTGLSDSQVRAFRHTSTLLVLKLMTGLVDVLVAVSIQMQTTQRLYDIECNKRASDRASDKLEELQTTISELQENREELSSFMNAAFRGVFVHRYRDRLPDIRAACIEELGMWLKMDPEDFLTDHYLKYLGWILHDKQSSVRLQCVRALQGLYQDQDFIGRLELFTSRFKERMLSMVLDKDPFVAVEVVKLLLLIQQSTEGGLKEEECGHIYPLVYASHRSLASAAGVFLYNKLKNVIDSENQEGGGHDNAAFFQILISFYIQSEFHEHGAYLVDSLWGVADSELRDWETMTALLLQESVLMYEEEGALIELMMCAMRQAAEVTPPVGRTPGKKFLSSKDRKIQDQNKRRITTHFIPLLPQLLAKYSADAGKMSLLLKAPLYFNLEMYSSAQWMEKNLDMLLTRICGVVEKHTQSAVLDACATLACTLCADCHAFSSRANLAFSQLLDSLTECFNTYLNDLLQGNADEDSIYSAATALKRISAFSSAKDVTRWKLFEPCLELLKSGTDSGDLNKELIVSALKCAGFHLMWVKVNVINSTPTEAELKHLKKEVRLFCRLCQTCLSVSQSEIRDQAFELLCDLLLLYSVSSVRSEPAIQTLVYLPSDALRSELAAFLLDYIFTDNEDVEVTSEDEEEMKITILQKKRNLLAGYCKLIIYGVLDLTAVTVVFKHYNKYFKDFGDIIKETVSKSKLINPVQSAKTVCLSLQQMFTEMLIEGRGNEDLGEIRDLAKRLAMSFGIDLKIIRKPLVALHMDGIRFAFLCTEEEGEQHPNLDFLEILSEFSFKLLQQDRAQLSVFLKEECPTAVLSWPSVRLYRRSIERRSACKHREQEEGGGEKTSPISSHTPPAAKRKRTTAQGSVSSTNRGSWLESSSIHSNLPTPALTSTVQRQPAKQLKPRRPGAADSDGSGVIESDSGDEFSSESQMRKVKPNKRRQPSSSQSDPALGDQDLDSHLTLLSLIEEDEAEKGGGSEIDDYESDTDNDPAYILPSTRHTSASILDELFQ